MRGFLVYKVFTEKLSPPGPRAQSANQRMGEQAGAKSYRLSSCSNEQGFSCFISFRNWKLFPPEKMVLSANQRMGE